MVNHKYERIVLDRFRYRGFHGLPSYCCLELLPLYDDRTVAVAIEREDNSGTSITNVVEYLASTVCDRFGIDPDRLIWIEHYAYGTSTFSERTFDRVTFTRRKRDSVAWATAILAGKPDGWPGYFQEPQWRPMNARDWTALGLTPRPPIRYAARR